MRIVVDYRPALRERTGVGEYIHELARAYAAAFGPAGDRIDLFTSSWKDRPAASLGREVGAGVIDWRVPVRVLNYAWHRLEWPPIERLAGAADVVHAAHPLLIPSRTAAQVVTIHDLFFLDAPERTRAEIRRDYGTLAGAHARRADAVLTSTAHGRELIATRLGVPRERIHVCSPGAPTWRRLGRGPNVSEDGYILFIGTLEPRKNIGALLDAYALLAAARSVPRLVLAGRTTPDAAVWLSRAAAPPLAGLVEHRGYVPGDAREALYAGARMVVLPSLDEGFGLPLLEAMSAGVPVVASRRGALPEVSGGAAVLVEPHADAIAAGMRLLLDDPHAAAACAARGLARARDFTWGGAAAALRGAYLAAAARRGART